MPKKRLVIPENVRVTPYVSYRQSGGGETTLGYVIGFFPGYTDREYLSGPTLTLEPRPWLSKDPQVRIVYEARLPIANEWSLHEEYMPVRCVTFHCEKDFAVLLDRMLHGPPPEIKWPAWTRSRDKIEPFLRLD